MATTTTTTKNALFVQVPVSVLEAEMPDSHKIGFQRLIYKCFREHSDQVRGSYRGIAKLLKVAKTSLIRMLPLWAELGWIFFEKHGKELIITLRNLLQAVPPRDTAETGTSPNEPPRDKAVPPRDESVPTLSLKQAVISSNTTDTLLLTSLLKVSSDSSFPVPPRDTEDGVPILTTELALSLVSNVLPVPQRPTDSAALDRWYQKWYTPTEKLIASMQPLLSGPNAWRVIDEVTRYMRWSGSWWAQNRGIPTMENVEKTCEVQLDKMKKEHWEPEERTPYPAAVPQWDTEEQMSQEGAQGVWDAQPFTEQELEVFTTGILAGNPPLILAVNDAPDDMFILFIQTGPDDYLAIDEEIWNHPTAHEEAMIYRAIRYGVAQLAAQREREPVMV